MVLHLFSSLDFGTESKGLDEWYKDKGNIPEKFPESKIKGIPEKFSESKIKGIPEKFSES